MNENHEIILINEENIKSRILVFRGVQVIIDKDLAKLYNVETKRLNEQVRRNIKRFPKEFCFQLSEIEKGELVANCDRFNSLKHSTSFPYAFTEQGVAMLSAILNSKIAIKISIQIINTFILLKKLINGNNSMNQKIENIEYKQTKFQIETENKFDKIFNFIENSKPQRNQGIFYEGQIFDSHIFISDLIKSAKKEIILIDNYIDENTLLLFNKREKGVKVIIYTKIDKNIKLDLEKYNSQYEKIEIKEFNLSHDRFLIIDNKEVYYIGASLKDLGKKWFAFSKLDKENLNILEKLK